MARSRKARTSSRRRSRNNSSRRRSRKSSSRRRSRKSRGGAAPAKIDKITQKKINICRNIQGPKTQSEIMEWDQQDCDDEIIKAALAAAPPAPPGKKQAKDNWMTAKKFGISCGSCRGKIINHLKAVNTASKNTLFNPPMTNEQFAKMEQKIYSNGICDLKPRELLSKYYQKNKYFGCGPKCAGRTLCLDLTKGTGKVIKKGARTGFGTGVRALQQMDNIRLGTIEKTHVVTEEKTKILRETIVINKKVFNEHKDNALKALKQLQALDKMKSKSKGGKSRRRSSRKSL